MRSYWLRILMGAFAIFAIGMVGVTLVRRGRSQVESVIASSEPLSIPLPFVPFQLDGSKLGTIERLTINREAPKKVSSIELQVKMDDSLVAKGLAGCRLAANIESDSSASGHRNVDVNVHLNRLDQRTFFFCAKSDSGFQELGSATLVPGDVELPLLIPETLAEQLRTGDWASGQDSTNALEVRADSIADAAQAVADSAEAQATRATAKAQRLSEVQTRLGDSLRAEGLRRADSIVRATNRMADSLQAR